MTPPEISHLSYSSVSCFNECPAKFSFRYIEKVKTPSSPALVFGSAWHATVGATIAGIQAGEDVDSGVLFAEAWARVQEQEIDWEGRLPDEFENDGIRMIGNQAVKKAIHDLRPQMDSGEPVIEKRVELHVPGVPVPVLGFIDFIDVSGLAYDFKTASRAWAQDQAQQESQPLYYLAALNQIGHPHRVGEFRHMVFTKARTPQVQQLDTVRTNAEIFWMFGVVVLVWQDIVAGRFRKNPNACMNYGKRCEYWSRCKP